MDDIPRSIKILLFLVLSVITLPVLSEDDETFISNNVSFRSDSTNLLLVFSAKLSKKDISLIWKVHDPSGISHFQIEKNSPKSKTFESLKKIIYKTDFIEKNESKSDYVFSYTDIPEYDGVYFYRLKAYDGGKLIWQSDEIKVGISGIKDFILEQNTPNPFNPTTNISYELESETHVKLRVFDLIGKEIAKLVDSYQGAGKYTVEFNAADYPNMTSGIYFYKLETEKYYDVKKMIISK